MFGPKFEGFYFCTKLETNLKALISNMTIAFQDTCSKQLKKTFLVSNLRIFILSRNFAIRQFGRR